MKWIAILACLILCACQTQRSDPPKPVPGPVRAIPLPSLPKAQVFGSSPVPTGPAQKALSTLTLDWQASGAATVLTSSNLVDWVALQNATSPLTIAVVNDVAFFKVVSAKVVLAWDDSDPLAAGFKIYWGHASRVYQGFLDVGYVTSGVLSLDPGFYYFAVTAYGNGLESDYSNEVSTQIDWKQIPARLSP